MKPIIKKILEKATELIRIAEDDEDLYGDSYLEIGERSIRLLDPAKVKITFNQKGKIKKLPLIKREKLKN